jgi:hypothetical protein
LRARIDAQRILSSLAGQALDELLDVSLSDSIHQLDDDLAVMLVAPRPEFVRTRWQHVPDSGSNTPT